SSPPKPADSNRSPNGYSPSSAPSPSSGSASPASRRSNATSRSGSRHESPHRHHHLPSTSERGVRLPRQHPEAAGVGDRVRPRTETRGRPLHGRQRTRRVPLRATGRRRHRRHRHARGSGRGTPPLLPHPRRSDPERRQRPHLHHVPGTRPTRRTVRKPARITAPP